MNDERRENRIPVSMQGRYRTGNGMANDVVVSDVSTMGCKFFDRFGNLDVGAFLTIRVGNVGPLEASVMWTEERTVGVRFETALHTSVLEHMVVTIPDWQPPPDPAPETQTRRVTETPPVETIKVTIRRPTEADIRIALRELQMALPLRTEVEFEAVLHRVLERICVQ